MHQLPSITVPESALKRWFQPSLLWLRANVTDTVPILWFPTHRRDPPPDRDTGGAGVTDGTTNCSDSFLSNVKGFKSSFRLQIIQ